jgi:hypothetical protein
MSSHSEEDMLDDTSLESYEALDYYSDTISYTQSNKACDIFELCSSAGGVWSTECASSAGKSSVSTTVPKSNPKQDTSDIIVVNNSGSEYDYDDILFMNIDVYSKQYKNIRYCKVCGRKETDNVKFPSHRKFICQKCASKESNFCRVRNVLIRTFKKLNVDVNTAVRILMDERNLIYKDLPNRKEKVIIK